MNTTFSNPMRYTIHDMDGKRIGEAPDAQRAGDACIDHIEASKEPAAYHVDTAPGLHHPYTVYQRDPLGWSGDTFEGLQSARAFIELIRNAHAYGHPLPVVRPLHLK